MFIALECQNVKSFVEFMSNHITNICLVNRNIPWPILNPRFTP